MKILLHLFVFLFFIIISVPEVQAGQTYEGKMYFSDRGYIYIKLKVKGIEGLHYFLLDINGRNFLRKDKIDLLNPDIDPKSNAYLKFEEVEYAGEKWRNQSFRLMNAKRHFGSDMMPDSVIGGIGYKFLRNYCWQINYRDKKLLFNKKGDQFSFNKDVLVFHAYSTLIDKSVSLYLSLNHEPDERFVLSTAWPLGICMSPETLGNPSIGLHGNGKVIYPQLRSMEEVEVYSYVVEDIIINEQISFRKMNISVSGRFESIIGNDFLKNFIVTIDWNKQKVFLEPYDHFEKFIQQEL